MYTNQFEYIVKCMDCECVVAEENSEGWFKTTTLSICDKCFKEALRFIHELD